LARKGLLVVGNIGALVVRGANAAVLEGVLVKVSAYAVGFKNGQVLTTHDITSVSTSGGTLIRAKLRARLELSAAPCLAKAGGDRVGIDGDSRVSALSGNEAREGRSGEDDGGVEHDDGEVWRWRSGSARRRQQVFAKEQAGRARWQGCCLVGASMLTWLFVEREWGINGRGSASCD
jgi:hypothetical protein